MAEALRNAINHRRAALLIGAALRYTGRGMSVLPIHSGQKTIDTDALRASGAVDFRGVPSWRSFSRRLATADEICTWFSKGDSNIAIVGGIQDLLILDFDTADTFDIWSRAYGHVAARTSVQKTARGFHVLLTWPSVWTTIVRTGTGFRMLAAPEALAGRLKGPLEYVVAWPSVHPTGWRYRWLPQQAPWDVGIMRIGNLEEIGLVADKKIPGAYFEFLGKLRGDPALGIRLLHRWLTYRLRRARGMKARS
jgi:hypothetical protein